ncbi:serine hydrolase domain-containing protein [Maribacter sp. X9]|uniref:serine hydrolase domain-containing protein n=1 Tax=Maribacter sp. X9 TaxID=3402159 RepID=UPI003AF35E8C
MNPILKYLKNVFASERILGDDPNLKGFLKADALLQNLVQSKKVPGLAITILKEGKTLFQKGYGYADVEKKSVVNPQQTIFRVASISKPIAATALAIMVQDGLINLDTSFYQYVPYYPKKRWDFTIRQLASHTAGIRTYQGKEYGLNEPYGIKDGLIVFQDADLLFEPGRGYLYTSFDWVLISLAMQEASGIPFEQYVQKRVLNPLDMKNTFAPKNPELGKMGTVISDTEASKNKASFYTKCVIGFRKAIPVNNYYKLAGGGYLSTSEDVAKLGQAYLDGKLLSAAMRSQFLDSQTVLDKPTFYGLGWQVSEDAKGRKFYGHIGNGVGGYSNLFIYPEQQMVFSILINCTDPKMQIALDEVVDSFFDKR